VISVELNSDRTGLLYRTWHLKDCAWCENADGEIDTVYRKWNPTARMLSQTFRRSSATLHPKVTEQLEKQPYQEFKCLHVMLPSEHFGTFKEPWMSVYVDCDNKHIIEQTPVWNKRYIVPRWQTVSGSQYAFSPAAIAALPEARMIQAMTRTLLEAGEKYVNPPMVAVQEAVRSDISIYAGGITWLDMEYDERLGDALRPLSQDKSGYPIGMEMREDTRQIIGECFYLSKLQMPQKPQAMTAYEVSQHVQEYIRNAIPLFEPVEQTYNSPLCELTFDLLLRNGAFGSYDDIPPELRGSDIRFRFESPLTENQDRLKAGTFMETANLLATAFQIDPSAGAHLDIHTAIRDALHAVGAPAEWITTEEQAVQMVMAVKQQQQEAAMMEQAKAGSEAAKNLGVQVGQNAA
jgi:hypothetical protein